MQSTDNAQSFISFSHEYSPPRSRTTAASIWAPQPQLLDSTWPKTIDSFSRDAEKELQRSACVPNGRNFFVSGNGSEDVFGPVGLVGMPRKRDIGAIGDGRKKQSPDFDDSHVEQLLRALNLNSPALYAQQPSRPQILDSKNVSTGSPDFSPSSTVSALLTPTDLSPAKTSFDLKINPPHELAPSHSTLSPSSLLFDNGSPLRAHEFMSHNVHQRFSSVPSSNLLPPSPLPYFEQSSENSSPALSSQQFYDSAFAHLNHPELSRGSWRQPQQLSAPSEWLRVEEKLGSDYPSGVTVGENSLRTSPSQPSFPPRQNGVHAHEPINFLSLLHPSSSPPYNVFVARIIKSSDQQASIFLQQKLKVADLEERHKIVDAICARGFEMMSHRFGNWAVQRCLEAAATPEERKKIVNCMRGRVVDLATNCYGCHVLQKALDCEEDIRLLIVSELLLGDPALTLVNKHASHVWSKIMELTWTAPAPPIFAFVNKSLKGKWASLACHETGSLVVQHAFENLEESAKDGIIDELLNQGPTVFGEIAKNQWGSYCIQHILEHGSPKHRQMCLDHIMSDLLDYATNEQGYKSVTKALKETGPETLDRIVKRMCEPAKGGRRAMIVDLALSVTGSQLIASTLPQADKDQRTTLYDCIRGHIVTLRGCKTGSKVIWLFDRMRAYYGY
ncbi:armadillo-type protein [Suillus discolor]|uniref:Armadillo-type protein n=1 Tax=Suillus discolor TaxID=1912936 RepID=A0A9P7JTA6_9AGAM|nr:armadillo-type protein [Suillus discolor]KAG2107002.1 armadillo-type protein [Suillus discolor]